jgi:hypothetical protein
MLPQRASSHSAPAMRSPRKNGVDERQIFAAQPRPGMPDSTRHGPPGSLAHVSLALSGEGADGDARHEVPIFRQWNLPPHLLFQESPLLGLWGSMMPACNCRGAPALRRGQRRKGQAHWRRMRAAVTLSCGEVTHHAPLPLPAGRQILSPMASGVRVQANPVIENDGQRNASRMHGKRPPEILMYIGIKSHVVGLPYLLHGPTSRPMVFQFGAHRGRRAAD